MSDVSLAAERGVIQNSRFKILRREIYTNLLVSTGQFDQY